LVNWTIYIFAPTLKIHLFLKFFAPPKKKWRRPLLKLHPHTTFRPTPTPLCIDAARSNWFLLISHLIYSPLLSIWVFTTGGSGNNNRFAVMKSVLVSAWSN
jgi:hypothetical protein